MNKLTKIGLSALCGSLASVSAVNAGTLEVTGSATMTHTIVDKTTVGNPIGMKSGITFTGNGELDGGQTFKLSLTDANKAAWSTGSISLTTNRIGTFKLNSGGGGAGIGGYDDNMPRAYEEVWDTAIATNVNLQKGVSGSTNLTWTSPKALGTTLQVAYAPDNDGATNINKAYSGEASNHFGKGLDVVLDIDAQGTSIGSNLFIGYSETDVQRTGGGSGTKALTNDHEEAVIGLELTLGPLQIGGQVSAERIQTQARNAANYYGNSSWGVAFNVNDDLSISYGQTRHVQSKTKKQSAGGMQTPSIKLASAPNNNINEYTPKSWMRGDSIQIAYSIGGVALKYAQTDYDNTAYGFDAKAPRSSRIVEVSLAF
jgi:hypothetical protein